MISEELESAIEELESAIGSLIGSVSARAFQTLIEYHNSSM